MEFGRCRTKECPFGIQFGLRVQRDGVQSGSLIHQFFGLAVYRATRCEDESLDSVALRYLYHHPGSRIVDLESRLTVLVTSGITDNRRQVDNRRGAMYR